MSGDLRDLVPSVVPDSFSLPPLGPQLGLGFHCCCLDGCPGVQGEESRHNSDPKMESLALLKGPGTRMVFRQYFVFMK